MTAPVIPAERLPEVRTSLVSDYARELRVGRGPLIEAFKLQIMAGAQPGCDPAVRDLHEQARRLAAAERRRLSEATLYWVSPQMTALALAAAPSMPAFRPTAADLPSAHGLVYFAAPLLEVEERPAFEWAVMDDGTVHQFRDMRVQVCAAAWSPFDGYGHWPQGGTWFSFYTPETDDQVAEMARRAGIPVDQVRRRPIWLDNECAIGAAPMPGVDDAGLLPKAMQEGTAAWVHLLLCAFRLMATSRTARLSEHTPPRATRRRAARLGVAAADQPVRLVDVTAPPRRECVDDGHAGNGQTSGRTYRVRWIVDGHWRNQWYPASETHRPRYIDAYVKGPEGAPLKLRETVKVWRDPSERSAR